MRQKLTCKNTATHSDTSTLQVRQVPVNLVIITGPDATQDQVKKHVTAFFTDASGSQTVKTFTLSPLSQNHKVTKWLLQYLTDHHKANAWKNSEKWSHSVEVERLRSDPTRLIKAQKVRRLYCGKIAVSKTDSEIQTFLEKQVFNSELQKESGQKVLKSISVVRNELGWYRAVKVAQESSSGQQPSWKSICVTLTPETGKESELFALDLNLQAWPAHVRSTVRQWSGRNPTQNAMPSETDWQVKT